MNVFDNYIVVGTGSVALSCAEILKRYNLKPLLIESRTSGLSSLRSSCERKGVTFLSIQGKELTNYLSSVSQRTLIVSAANRYLFPPDVVNKTNLTIVNYHGALLPKHPGRNAEAWAIYEGDAVAGITWHYVVADVDAGNIICQKSVPITDKTTSFSLLRANSKLVVEGLEEILPMLLDAPFEGTRQTERHKVHYSWMKPNNGELDLSWDADKISAFLRAMDYGPLQTLGYPVVGIDNKRFSVLSYTEELSGLESSNVNTIQIKDNSSIQIIKGKRSFNLNIEMIMDKKE